MDWKRLETITPADEAAMARARAHWDCVAKPLGSLGRLEDAVTRISGLTGDDAPSLDKRAVLVLCADNGVTREGVAQTPPEVTAVMAGVIAQGRSSVCRMARRAGAEIAAVDMGMFSRVPGTLDRRVADGTASIAQGAAMTRAQCEQAIETGIALVADYKQKGYHILVTGEMGIGNTTTSSAVAAALLKRPPASLTGRGAGLSDEHLARKIAVVERALAVNAPDPDDPVDVLAKLGGFDIAGMTGIFLGGALYRVPIVIDGLISSVAALAAARIRPAAASAMLASHLSAEPAAPLILGELGLSALLHAEMRLGEGTGGVCLLPLLDMALAVYNEALTYAALSEAMGGRAL